MKTETQQTVLFNPGIVCNFQEISCNYKPARKQSDLPKICGSQDSYEHLKLIYDKDMRISYNESFVILLLNRANRLLGYSGISQGGISGTVADPKLIFQHALKGCASSIILCHNHPSGNTQPSEADIQLTRKLKECGIFLDLPVLDHLIIAEDKYFSFADEGLL